MSGFRLGELILSSKPYAYVLSNEFRGLICDYCFTKRDELKRCSQCSFLYFCNKYCQVQSWKDHKSECKFIKKAGGKSPMPSLRLIALIIFKIKKYGQHNPFEEVNGRKVTFATLMSHAEDIKRDLKRTQIMMAMFITLKEYIGSYYIPSPEEFIDIFGKMCVNSFSICNGEMAPIGSGLYLGASVLDHSCDPEAVAIFDGTDLNVRIIKKFLPHRDFNKIYISYIGELQLKEEKQKQLAEQYYFNCKCPSCTSSKDEELKTKLLFDTDECKQQALKCHQELERIKQMVKDREESEVINEACVKLLEIENEILGDINITKIKTLEIAFDTCIDLQIWSKAHFIASRLDWPLRFYFGNHHPQLGIHLFKLGKILYYHGHTRLAVRRLREAKDILEASHGEQHALTSELSTTLMEACFALEDSE